MVRENEKTALTLAIGDGTNDVSMIKEAHVGIGIKGLEGTEAAASADYAIGTFKHLGRLTLVHGRNFAYKIDYYLYKFMYKNLIVAISGIAVGFLSGFGGIGNLDNAYVGGISVWIYNLDTCQWTMAEQDQEFRFAHTEQQKFLLPYVYSEQKIRNRLTFRTYIKWFLYSCLAALTGGFVCLYAFGSNTLPNGYITGYWDAMQVNIMWLVLSHDWQTVQFTYNMTWVFFLVTIINLLFWFPTSNFIDEYDPESDEYGLTFYMIFQPVFFFTVLLMVISFALPVRAMQTMREFYKPSISMVCRLVSGRNLN
jgi:magnesium-transporting ATPase (P-type)